MRQSHFRTFRVRRGQTLLELLTALFVLSLVLVGALALTNSNFRLEGIGSSRLVATNLAREGVELARSIRDSNWLSSRAFDDGLSDTNHCAVLSAQANQPFVDHFTFLECKDGFDASFQLYQSADGRYSADAAFGNLSQIFRNIRLDPICLDASNVQSIKTDTACDPGTKIGLQVKGEVGWYYAGQKMTVVLTEQIYDWQ
ncbi:MAG: prepilin-type N-terminal cleavage/methylation domain-containing protein [Patescibacteria group bacterium]